MSIASDPNPDTLATSEDDFDKYFNEFATGKVPDPEKPAEDVKPEGNDPVETPPAPAPAATETEKPTEDVTSGDAEPEGGDKPPEGQAPDPWANVPEELKSQFEAVQRERDEARHKAQSDANRVAALSRKLQQLSVAPPASAPAPAAEPTEAQKALDAKIKTLREDYGDIAEPLIELIEQQKQELTTVRATLEGLSEERQAQVIATERLALEERHPDWQPIAQSEEFGSWLDSQPQNIQRLATSWDARETSVVLTLFKAERGGTAKPAEPAAPVATEPKADAATGARRSQQLDGGRDVRSRPAPAASGPPEDFDAAFAYFEEQRRLKAAQGR